MLARTPLAAALVVVGLVSPRAAFAEDRCSSAPLLLDEPCATELFELELKAGANWGIGRFGDQALGATVGAELGLADGLELELVLPFSAPFGGADAAPTLDTVELEALWEMAGSDDDALAVELEVELPVRGETEVGAALHGWLGLGAIDLYASAGASLGIEDGATEPGLLFGLGAGRRIGALAALLFESELRVVEGGAAGTLSPAIVWRSDDDTAVKLSAPVKLDPEGWSVGLGIAIESGFDLGADDDADERVAAGREVAR